MNTYTVPDHEIAGYLKIQLPLVRGAIRREKDAGERAKLWTKFRAMTKRLRQIENLPQVPAYTEADFHDEMAEPYPGRGWGGWKP